MFANKKNSQGSKDCQPFIRTSFQSSAKKRNRTLSLSLTAFPVESNSPDYMVFLSFHKLQNFLAVSPFQKTPKDKMLNLCLSLHFDL